MLVNLMAFLANHPGTNVETVCEVFGLSRRQLMKALNEILMCGIPPYGPSDYVAAWVEGERVTVVNADFMRAPLRMTVPEAVSLRVMIEDFVRQSPGVFNEAAQSLTAKIDALLGRASQASAPLGPSRHKESQIEQALVESRALEIEYYSRMMDSTTRRVVEPIAVVDLDGRWYLAAYCRLRSAERSFRIDRIRSARMLDERIEKRARPDVGRYVHAERWFARPFAPKVHLTFSPQAARWAREQFAKNVVGETEDGGLQCELPATDPITVGDILADYAGNVDAAGADEMREIFQERVKAIRDLYERPPDAQ